MRMAGMLGGAKRPPQAAKQRPAKKTPPAKRRAWPPPEAVAAAAAGAKLWVSDRPDIAVCALTAEEVKAAGDQMERDFFTGKNPAPAGEAPHLVLAMGAPGSGKHTLARLCVEALNLRPVSEYVEIDFDALIKYHPRANGVWDVADMFGRPTGVGLAQGWMNCASVFVPLAETLLNRALEKRYNLILYTHWHLVLMHAQNAGFTCTLLYVAAPLDVALRRARSRAATTGKFLSPTLKAQDELVTRMWTDYQQSVAWFALWADTVALVPNGDDRNITVNDFIFMAPHDKPWREVVDLMRRLVGVMHEKDAVEQLKKIWPEYGTKKGDA